MSVMMKVTMTMILKMKMRISMLVLLPVCDLLGGQVPHGLPALHGEQLAEMALPRVDRDGGEGGQESPEVELSAGP